MIFCQCLEKFKFSSFKPKIFWFRTMSFFIFVKNFSQNSYFFAIWVLIFTIGISTPAADSLKKEMILLISFLLV